MIIPLEVIPSDNSSDSTYNLVENDIPSADSSLVRDIPVIFLPTSVDPLEVIVPVASSSIYNYPLGPYTINSSDNMAYIRNDLISLN